LATSQETIGVGDGDAGDAAVATSPSKILSKFGLNFGKFW